MKRTIILSMAGLVLLAACQKEISPVQQEKSGMTLSATVEQQTYGTKTALGSGNTVVWSHKDEVRVWNGDTNTNTPFTLTEGVGTTQGRFNGEEIKNPQYAFYPSSAVTGVSGPVATFTLPAVQHYVENSFDNGANVAVAQISGNNMEFKNICGVLKLQLKGTTRVKTIVLSGKANEKLNGEYSVKATDSTPDVQCKTTELDSEKFVTLDCGEGIQLAKSMTTDFYFVVPKGAFASGFNVVITDILSGNENFVAPVNTVNRSKILSMPEKYITLHGPFLPGEFTVNASGKKVLFASGNLIATIDAAGNPTAWKINPTQYSNLGDGGANTTIGSVAGDVDYFGVVSDGATATSGYKPWGINTSTTNSDYDGNLLDIATNPTLQANIGKFWRTITIGEMNYIINTRSTSTINGVQNARYALIKFNNSGIHNGIILFPDQFEWITETMGSMPTIINEYDVNYNSYIYTTAQLTEIGNAGVCIFCTDGCRVGNNIVGTYYANIRCFGKGRFYLGNRAPEAFIGSQNYESFQTRLAADIE